jgi:hypothetical protein
MIKDQVESIARIMKIQLRRRTEIFNFMQNIEVEG